MINQKPVHFTISKLTIERIDYWLNQYKLIAPKHTLTRTHVRTHTNTHTHTHTRAHTHTHTRTHARTHLKECRLSHLKLTVGTLKDNFSLGGA